VRKLQIAPSVKTELQNRSATSLEAYQFYLKGRSFWHRRYKGFLQKAIECFEQAVAKDPHYALAYTGLADCYLSLGVWGMADPNNVFRRAIALAEKALQIHPNLAEAHASRAVISIFYDWDWMAAERGLKQAIALNPGCAMTHLWYSHYLAILGLLRESVEEARQAQNLDPLSPIINGLLGYTLFLAREYESALLEIRKTLDLDPYFGTAHFLLGTVLAYQGKYSEAIEAQKRCLEMTGGLLQWAAGSLGYASALAGNRRAAGAILKEFDKKQTYIPPSARAMVYLGMGEDEKVYESLRKGYIERDALLPWIKVEPTFDRLRGRPQFKDLLKRMNLE
jgi:tetratricopeptide (TPR) repeat protein